MANKKLYIGNLPFSVSSEELRDLFASVGKVIKADVISDHTTGKSRGFGFVEMETVEQAETAMSELNERELQGRSIMVKEAIEKSRDERRPREYNDRGGDRRERNYNRR